MSSFIRPVPLLCEGTLGKRRVRLHRSQRSRQLASVRQKHAIDNVDDTIRLVDVGDGDFRLVPFAVDDPPAAHLVALNRDRFAFDRLQLELAAVGVGFLGERRSGIFAGNDVIGQNVLQLGLVFRLKKNSRPCLAGACRTQR